MRESINQRHQIDAPILRLYGCLKLAQQLEELVQLYMYRVTPANALTAVAR